MTRDRIYSLPRERVGDFMFDDTIVDVFPDMIARSVPGYASILSMIEQLTSRFVQPNSNLYDLGCSLGAATRLIRRQAPRSCTIHAVDSSAAMIHRLHDLLDAEIPRGEQCCVQLHEADIRGFQMTDASFIVLNLTLQFIAPEQRTDVVQAAFDALRPGGGMLLSEKICFDRIEQQTLLTELHHDFKRAHGYSDLEIAQKRTAIENRLVPETMQTHARRLEAVGFTTVAPWFQCFNFASILAVKADAVQ
jgi:tRNA (cmo5U34)-methyltransferase